MSISSYVFPTSDDHITDGPDCWCVPSYEKPCPICCGEDAEPDCRNCDGTGWLDATREEAIGTDCSVIVIHNKL